MKKNHVIAHPLTGKTYLRKLVYKPIDSVVQKDQLSFLCWASLAKFEFPFLPFSGSVQFFCCLFRFPLLVCTVIQLFRCFFFFLIKFLQWGPPPAVFAVKKQMKMNHVIANKIILCNMWSAISELGMCSSVLTWPSSHLWCCASLDNVSLLILLAKVCCCLHHTYLAMPHLPYRFGLVILRNLLW